ncbi:MAG: hypothetical protein ACLQUT_12750 [Thermoleophilia bacterium]
MQLQLNDLIRFAKKYQDLGNAVQEQLDDIVSYDYDDLNPNAVRMIEDFLTGVQQTMDIDGEGDDEKSLAAALFSCQEVLADAASAQ